MRLLVRNVMPCMGRSPRPAGPRSLPYVCTLPRGHDSGHEARLWGRTVYRWPRT